MPWSRGTVGIHARTIPTISYPSVSSLSSSKLLKAYFKLGVQPIPFFISLPLQLGVMLLLSGVMFIFLSLLPNVVDTFYFIKIKCKYNAYVLQVLITLWHRVISAFIKRVTSTNPFNPNPTPFYHSIFYNSFFHIFRACWIKTASRWCVY